MLKNFINSVILRENLCLYGFPSEQWEVNLPAEEVPPELPEPALVLTLQGMACTKRTGYLQLLSTAMHGYFPLPSISVQDLDLIKLIEPKDEEGLEDEDEDEHGETLCGACGENYASDEFWNCCDMCEKWFHGKCVKITPARAEHIKQYKCPSCSNKRARP
ncbi:ABC transporter G family member 16-like [Hibiscus syriacus]|uniref:PHD finger protein ALFIN-LIKE n=1 Tax=Hibiscus syriacus TaxID=106335 RepID=A0A6A2YHG6_HIBSY|nr:ABC transporter G family member 16-like [Hibiscus syriacus]